MTDSNHPVDVCAVVVTYHPDAACAARLRAVRADGTPVIVIDNGSATAELHDIEALALGESIELIRNEHNLGIATALNLGVHRAIERGYRWVLLLDQDTEVPAGAVRALENIAVAVEVPSPLAILGARFEDPMQRLSAPIRPAPPGARWDEVQAVITSGSLLSLDAYRQIGPFREDFFIDYVDIEYCMRARRKGFRVLRTTQPWIQHSVGHPRQGRFLWLRKWTTNHSPDRRYYMARNDTVMLRDSGTYSHGAWALKSASRRLQTCKRIALYEKDKTRKIAATLQGLWDGWRGHMGPRGGRRAARN